MAPENLNPSTVVTDEEVESAASFVRKRPPNDDEIDITPMIDCVFLLLIFFIINFRADAQKSASLPHAKYGNPVLGIESVFITVTSGEADTAQIYLADHADPAKLLRTTNLIDQEQAIAEYVREELARPAGNRARSQVIIKGDGKLRANQVKRVAEAVGRAIEGQTLHIAVTGESR